MTPEQSKLYSEITLKYLESLDPMIHEDTGPIPYRDELAYCQSIIRFLIRENGDLRCQLEDFMNVLQDCGTLLDKNTAVHESRV